MIFVTRWKGKVRPEVDRKWTKGEPGVDPESTRNQKPVEFDIKRSFILDGQIKGYRDRYLMTYPYLDNVIISTIWNVSRPSIFDSKSLLLTARYGSWPEMNRKRKWFEK